MSKPKSKPQALRNTKASLPAAERLTPADALLLEKLQAFAAAETHEADQRNRSAAAQAAVVIANDTATSAARRVLECSTAKGNALSELADVLKTRPDRPVKFGGSTFVYITNTGIRRFVGEPMVLGAQS